MAREYRTFFDQDAEGDVRVSATVNIYNAGTSTLATIYNIDGDALSQPLTTGSDGSFAFGAAEGEYDIISTLSGDAAQVSSVAFRDSGHLAAANDLSDVDDADTARLNLNAASYADNDGGTVASAAALDPDESLGKSYFEVTGTTTITSIAATAPSPLILRFAGALTLTHGATTIDLPGDTNITTVAGDIATFILDGTVWRLTNYVRYASAI